MTAPLLDGLRTNLRDCYKLLYEDSIKPTEALMSTPAMEERCIKELVLFRAQELGGRVQDFGKIFDSELTHFKERLSKYPEAIECFTSHFSAAMVEPLHKEGTRQIVRLLKAATATSRIEILGIVEQMKMHYRNLRGAVPDRPINRDAVPHIEMAIHEYNVQAGKELKSRVCYLNTQFFGGELLSRKELESPTSESLKSLSELAFSGIRSQLDRIRCSLQESGMLDAVLDDSSSYSQCWARKELDDLKKLQRNLFLRVCMPTKELARESRFLSLLVRFTELPSITVQCIDYAPLCAHAY